MAVGGSLSIPLTPSIHDRSGHVHLPNRSVLSVLSATEPKFSQPPNVLKEPEMLRNASQQELREAIESVYSLSHFYEIREVKRIAYFAEVRGTVHMSNVPGDNRQEAEKFAVDGFVYCRETYDVSSDCPIFCSLIFSRDPWLS